jgi:hypothetical protein
MNITEHISESLETRIRNTRLRLFYIKYNPRLYGKVKSLESLDLQTGLMTNESLTEKQAYTRTRSPIGRIYARHIGIYVARSTGSQALFSNTD